SVQNNAYNVVPHPRIAHAVRECKFYPRYIVGAVPNTEIAYNVLLDILLDTTYRFSPVQVLKLCALRCLGNLSLGNKSWRAFHPLLHLIPELAELKFVRPPLIQSNLPEDENFTPCPRQLLPHFVRPGALEHLNLWRTRVLSTDGSMDPMELYGALVGGDELVSVCDPEVLRTVQILEDFFPDAATQAWDLEMIMNALLTLPLPSTIQRLRLSSYSVVSRSGLVTEDRLARRKRDLG
ncbi:hypothetical protein DFJ58DRAFT_824531, partial [Suillus subalutaceus]|uniref:uncharacterized protein n=1 Tax=Suillus subalutaceus TaxID=48586 RepID=UPI001B865236